jgi:SAM-dependent methyltransferase
LHSLHPEKNFILAGYDVQDHGVQAKGFIQKTVSQLNHLIPEIDWNERIHTIQATSEWEFVTDKYDYIISNQVLEHVHDKNFFFANISSALNEGGHSIHLAPLKHIIHEGHIHLPWAHRITNFDALFGYIRLMSQLGFGKFKEHKKTTQCSLNDYSERHADYIYFWTKYSTEAETIQFARQNGLRADFRFSTEFFSSKLRQLLRLESVNKYHFRNYSFADSVRVKLLRYLSSVTLVCTKINKY